MSRKITHGAWAWKSGRCRCDVCRAASAEQASRAQQARIERLKSDPDVVEHGRYTTYINWGCRCGPCTEAQSAQYAKYMMITPPKGDETP